MFTPYETSKLLKPYVAFFFSIDFEQGDKESIDEICLPLGCGIMGFQFEGRCKIHIGNEIITPPKFYTTGQQTIKYNMVSKNPVLSITGPAFNPTGLWHLFGLNMQALVNKDIATETLFDDRLQKFTKQFYETKEPIARVQLIEALLLTRLQKVTPMPNMIDIAVDLIHKNHGCWPLKKILAKLNVSERYFEKRFKIMVGVPPSVYSRIVRFNYLFAAMDQNKKWDYKALGVLFNYYDFQHFSKDFKRFSGKPPSKFHVAQFHFINDYMVKNPIGVRGV